MRRIILSVLLITLTPLFITACGQSDAGVAAHNLSRAAEQFEVPRHIVAINGITDKYLLEVQGYCSLETADSGLTGAAAVICKTGEDKHGNALVKKSYVYLSDNVTFVVQQIDPIGVSTQRYRFIFKPETLIPNINLQ